MKTVLCSLSSLDTPFEKFATDCAEMGFNGIEATVLKPHLSPLIYRTKASRKKLKEFLQSKGLEISDLDQRSALSIPYPKMREHELIVFDSLCQMAVDLDCNIVKVDQAGATMYADPNIPWPEQRAWLLEGLKGCAEIAQDYGLKCGLHNHANTTVREP